MKKIGVLVGKRGGFDALLYVINAIKKEGMHPTVIVTDQNTRQDFGHYLDYILSKTKVDCILSLGEYPSTVFGRMDAMATLMGDLSSYLSTSPVDAMVLYGDRMETLVTAQVCLNFGIPIFHLQGGEWSGGVDNSIRWAITRMAAYHFCSGYEARKELENAGEPISRIEAVGEIKIDRIYANDLMPVPWETKKADKIVMLHHANTEVPEKTDVEMKAIYDALQGWDVSIRAFYPCTDPGFDLILAWYQCMRKNGMEIEIYKDVSADEFLGHVCAADLFIGNSSVAIIECPALYKPSIIVGDRQRGRAHDSYWTQIVPPQIAPIVRALSEYLRKGKRTAAPIARYTSGRAAPRIAGRIRQLLEDSYPLLPKVYR